MKDSFVKIALAIAFVLCGGYNVLVSQQSETFSDLMVANVEALANAREIDGEKRE
ncbi:NVEALA domain-containing protein [Bacteroides sp. MSB163]|uniref:NVEALA domain-containing protein n=1 Tax=Bacteroides maternus TaxID=3117552 RepID=UPI002ED98EE7